MTQTQKPFLRARKKTLLSFIREMQITDHKADRALLRARACELGLGEEDLLGAFITLSERHRAYAKANPPIPAPVVVPPTRTFIRPDPAKKYLVQQDLLTVRKWTKALVTRFLGDPDATKRNPTYRGAAAVRLFEVARVDFIEATPDFQQALSASMKRRGLATLPPGAVLQ